MNVYGQLWTYAHALRMLRTYIAHTSHKHRTNIAHTSKQSPGTTPRQGHEVHELRFARVWEYVRICMCAFWVPNAMYVHVCAATCAQKMCLDTYASRFMYVRYMLQGYGSMCAYVSAPFVCKMHCMCEHAVRESIYVRLMAYGSSYMCGVFC